MTANASAFDADDQERLEYRKVSALAIVALLFGLASPVALAAPLLFVIPLVGIAISLLSLRRIASSEGGLTGRRAAVAGLALCIGTLVMTFSHAAATKHLRSGQAESWGLRWIALVQGGELEQAYRLTSAANRPAGPEDPFSPPDDPKERFMADPLVEALAQVGSDAKVRLDKTLEFESRPGRQFIVRQQFSVSPQGAVADGEPSIEPFSLTLTLLRSRGPGGVRWRWLVANYGTDLGERAVTSQ